jgi:predicted nuclease of predicted toxin-antitoxin system
VKVLVDVNLPPSWAEFLRQHGVESTHWSQVGELNAPDATVMEWARSNGCVVFTHDLAYSALLAATRAQGPSVLQIRTHDVLPAAVGLLVVRLLVEHAEALEKGAILSVDLLGARVRTLPIDRSR